MRTNVNQVFIEGYVYNFSLFPNVAGPTSKNPGQEYINGTVNIATDEDGINVIGVRYTYVTPTWKSGKENETYTILQSLIDGAPTWEKDGKEKATKLRIQGDVEVNDFMGRDGSMVESKQVRGGFTHYANDGFRDKRNNFETDMLITKTNIVEVEDGPNYMNVSGYVFNFRNDFIPVTYTLNNEEGIKYFENLDISMNTPYYVYVWGKIVSATQKVERQVETAWGAPQVEYTTRSLRMWEIEGCSPDPYEFNDASTMTLAEMKQGLEKREQQKAEAKARQEARNTSSSGQSGFPVANATSGVSSPTAASNFKF